MNHFLFCDEETGEEFIVGAKDWDEAKQIAKSYFAEPVAQYQMSEMEAEASGLDEY